MINLEKANTIHLTRGGGGGEGKADGGGKVEGEEEEVVESIKFVRTRGYPGRTSS